MSAQRQDLPRKRRPSRAQQLRTTLRGVHIDDQARKYAMCRSLGHSWTHRGQVDESGTGVLFGYRGVRSACTECGMGRVKWISYSGESSTRYEQPEDYAQHGDDRLQPAQWRQALVVTLFGEDE